MGCVKTRNPVYLHTMVETLVAAVSHWIIVAIQSFGYGGVVILMALQNANIPIPSEIILPFSGFLVSQGAFSFWPLVLWSTLGCVLGSVLSYELAGWIVRKRHSIPMLALLISDRFLSKAEAWFSKYGAVSAFFSRMLPIVRTFISLPAGLGKMNRAAFVVYTAAGSFVWSVVLIWAGMALGEHWQTIGRYTHILDWVVLVGVIVAAVWWIRSHLPAKKPKQ